jgi:hypothetical protein
MPLWLARSNIYSKCTGNYEILYCDSRGIKIAKLDLRLTQLNEHMDRQIKLLDLLYTLPVFHCEVLLKSELIGSLATLTRFEIINFLVL